MMRIPVIFILLALQLNTIAQTNITGSLVSTDGEKPQGISILVHEKKSKNNIITFAFSDDNGKFTVDINSTLDSIGISTRSLSYRDTTIYLANKNQHTQLKLIPQVNHIKEVNVKGIPITTKEDTTTYMVGSFEKESDESIGDVIARMPGFDVDTKGKVYYQGKEIDKYYIEGLDLLERRYAIANKNLSNKAVGSVEVLHNHQPIKMLRNKFFNDGTSLNIKLKKKHTTTTRAQGSIGLPFLKYSANVTPMLFSPKNQMIASWQSNNTGNDLSTQHHPFMFSNNEIDNFDNTKTELLSISSMAPQTISNQQRYLLNNANLLSYNYLTKINEDAQFKTNISYYNDFIEEDAKVSTTYYIDSDTTYLEEITDNNFTKNSVISDFTYTLNGSEKYINNKLRFENYWNNSRQNINSSEQNEKAYMPFLSVANEFDLYQMIGKQFINFKAFIDYNHAPQKMRYQPGVFEDYLNSGEDYSEAMQLFSQDEIRTKVSASFTFKRKDWSFSTELENDYSYADLQSSIKKEGITIETDSLKNKLQWHNGEAFINEVIKYEKPNLKLRFSIPLSLVYYNINDQYHNAGDHFNQFLFKPYASANWSFKYYWTSSTSLSYRKQLGNVEDLTLGYIINDYQSLNQGSTNIEQNENISISSKLEYKNPLSGWLANASYKYKLTSKDIISNQISLGDYIWQSESVYLNNDKTVHNANGTISYFMSKWQTSVELKSSYTYNDYQYMLNDVLYNTHSNVSSAEFNFNCGAWRKFLIKYSYNYTATQQTTSQSTSKYDKNEHTASLFYYPNKQLWFNINYEYNNITYSSSEIETYFGDFACSYKPNKSKFNYKLELRNIFNAETLTQYSTSDISFIENIYYLRKRELLFKVSYRF
jgi:hypothetical protein